MLLMNGTTMTNVICISWQTEIMPVLAHDYFHFECLAQHTFKSEAIANGKRRELKVEEVRRDAMCEVCGRKLREAWDL